MNPPLPPADPAQLPQSRANSRQEAMEGVQSSVPHAQLWLQNNLFPAVPLAKENISAPCGRAALP